MDKMLIWSNVAAFGVLFAVWSKNSLLNAAIKVILLGLLIANVVAAVQ